MTKKIQNLNDLRYRKLYLRSKIKVKENKIQKQIQELKEESRSIDYKSELIKGIMDNPALVINTARITFDLIRKLRSRRREKKKLNPKKKK